MQTLDGVVAIPGLDRSNALIADESDADRFVMALLRACADAILIGAGTLRSSPAGTWRPDRAYPPAADALAELRRGRGRPELPAVAVVTGGASLDPAHPLLERGVTVLTTERAAPGLRARVPAASEVVAVNDGDAVDLAAALALLRERGHELILSEAGPTVLGGLLAARPRGRALPHRLAARRRPRHGAAARARRGPGAAPRRARRGVAPLAPPRRRPPARPVRARARCLTGRRPARTLGR